MAMIISPLRSHMQGPTVADLQDSLQLLLVTGVLLADDERLRRELSTALRNERAEQTFGGATGKLASRFHEKSHLQTSGAAGAST